LSELHGLTNKQKRKFRSEEVENQARIALLSMLQNIILANKSSCSKYSPRHTHSRISTTSALRHQVVYVMCEGLCALEEVILKLQNPHVKRKEVWKLLENTRLRWVMTWVFYLSRLVAGLIKRMDEDLKTNIKGNLSNEWFSLSC